MLTRINILFATLVIGVLSGISGIGTDNPDVKNICLGIFGSAVFALILGLIDIASENSRLSFLKGDYTRCKITNRKDERDPDGAYEDLTPRYNAANIDSKISIVHNGEGEYSGTAIYEQGKVRFTINLDRINPSVGSGTYQYVDKKPGLPDIGTLAIQVDSSNRNILYVFYSNVIPSGLASGYEIWEK